MKIPRIMFVDDEPNILTGIRRALNEHSSEWDMAFFSDGHDALKFMDEFRANVVVTDIAMPTMDGKSLIYKLHERFPDSIPIVLSGHWDMTISLKELGQNVRFLGKPLRRDLLVWAIKDAVADSRFSPSNLLRHAPPIKTLAFKPPVESGAVYSDGWTDVLRKIGE